MARTNLYWWEEVIIVNFRLWSYNDNYLEWSQDEVGHVPPSDSTKRIDLQSIKNEDFDNAQKYKEELENLQRKDKKLRQENNDK
jgi:hypothetical protein